MLFSPVVYIKMTRGRKKVNSMNAVILASGVGLRMRDIAQRGHKALLPIGEFPIIERIIRYLKEAGINDITVITGHKKELFQFLQNKYDVRLLHNKKYSVNNNLRSIEMVLQEIGDTFIIHSDVVLFKNLFKNVGDRSLVYTILKESNGTPVFHPTIDKQRAITGLENYVGSEAVTTPLGISYWTKEDADVFREYFRTHVDNKLMKKFHLEWEEVLLNLHKSIEIKTQQVDRKYAKDINLIHDFLDASYIYDQLWKEKS